MSDRLDILAKVTVDRSELDGIKSGAADVAAELTKVNTASTNATKATQDHAAATGSLKEGLQSLAGRGGQVRETIEGISQVSAGGTRSLFGLAKAVQGLWSILSSANPWTAIITAIGAATVAVGTYIKKLWDAGNATADFNGILKNAEENTAHLNNRMAEAGKISLASTQSEIEALSKKLTRASEDTERLIRMQASLRGAKSDMDAARIKIAEARGDLTPEAAAQAMADLTLETAEGNINADETTARTSKSDARHREVMTASKLSEAQKKRDDARDAFQTSLKNMVEMGYLTADEEKAALAGQPGALDKPLQRRQESVAKGGVGDITGSTSYIANARRQLNTYIEAEQTYGAVAPGLQQQIEADRKQQRASDDVLGLIPSRRESAALNHQAAIAALPGSQAQTAAEKFEKSFHLPPGAATVRDNAGQVVPDATSKSQTDRQNRLSNIVQIAQDQLRAGADSDRLLAQAEKAIAALGMQRADTQEEIKKIWITLTKSIQKGNANRAYEPQSSN